MSTSIYSLTESDLDNIDQALATLAQTKEYQSYQRQIALLEQKLCQTPHIAAIYSRLCTAQSTLHNLEHEACYLQASQKGL